MHSNRNKKVAGLCTLIVSGLLFTGWMASIAAARNGSNQDRVYGGRMSHKTRILVNRLHEDLKSTDRILCAESDRLRFLDKENETHEFRFLYGALWRDDYPLLTAVKAFHFEFRDGRGNLLNASRSPDQIAIIGYVLHLTDQGREVMANLSVRIPARDSGRTGTALAAAGLY